MTVLVWADVDEIEAIVLDVAAASDLVRERPGPRVRLREFGDSGPSIEMLCWIDDPRFTGRARDALMRAIYAEFRATGIEIPYPRRDLRVRGDGSDDGTVGRVEATPRESPSPRDGESGGGSKAN